jgi:Carboxypeptidase regulatory-like domain
VSVKDAHLQRLGGWLIGACLLLPIGWARAQDRAPGNPPTNAKAGGDTYTLTGSVIDSLTGEPIRHAAVQISSAQISSMVLTDDAGHFLVEGLPEGAVSLSVVKPGYSQAEMGQAEAEVSRNAPPVVLKITPEGVIFGQVTTRDGQPLEGFRVRLVTQQNVEGRATLMDLPNPGQTNDDGEFRIAGLAAGSYYIVIDQSQETTPAQHGVPNAREQIYGKVLYPGVSDFSAATALEITPGQRSEANFSLSPEPVYAVSGEATGLGNLLSPLTFMRKQGQEEDFIQPVNVQDGKFQTKLPAGSYRVVASVSDGSEASMAGGPVTISGDSAAVEVPLAPTTRIPVQIRTEPGERDIALAGLMVQLIPVSLSDRFPARRWWIAATGGLDDVGPGEYALQIQTTGNWWVKSATCNGVDLLGDNLNVTDGGATPPIEITLQDGAGSLNGKVNGAGQWSQALVLLVQTRGKRNSIQTARVMGGGYAFPGVAPGDYAVVAIDHGAQLEYANPEVLSPYLGNAEPVSVPSRGSATVNLNLVSVKK